MERMTSLATRTAPVAGAGRAVSIIIIRTLP
jgi:hypothetical protein